MMTSFGCGVCFSVAVKIERLVQKCWKKGGAAVLGIDGAGSELAAKVHGQARKKGAGMAVNRRLPIIRATAGRRYSNPPGAI